MKKKILVTVLALIMAGSMAACEGDADKPVINDEVGTDTDRDISETNITEESTEDLETENEEEESYSSKIYYVGDDIPAGTYVVNCTQSDYGMDVVIFSSEKEYTDFQNAEQFTVGEYRTAIETHAWASLYIEEGNSAYIGLEEGNVILLDAGMCEFNKYDTMTSNVLYPGIYVVGKDIPAETLDINCTDSYLEVTVFENKENYMGYHRTDRFTIGEEEDAIEKYSLSNELIYKDGSTSVNLTEGMILMIEDGTGEYSVDGGPVINEEASSNAEGISPEFKEMMDSYEAFFDEYVEFMKKYTNADATSIVSMMQDYTDYMTRYAEMTEKLSALENEEMSTEEALYYTEVSSRITQKLLELQ